MMHLTEIAATKTSKCPLPCLAAAVVFIHSSFVVRVLVRRYWQVLSMVVSLCTKPMKTAEYLCTGTLGDDADFGHYALNMPFYTHFTSPIRRYPDVLVHRLLEAALEMDRGGGGGGVEDADDGGSALQHIMGLDAARQGKICKHCNQKKTNSKQAQEASDKIHMCVMLRAKPMEVRHKSPPC